MPTAKIDDHADRGAYIRGLRQLADYLEQHPDVPAERFGTAAMVFAYGGDTERHAQIEALAAVLDAPVTAEAERWITERHFDGGVCYRALGLRTAAVDAWDALTSYHGSVTT